AKTCFIYSLSPFLSALFSYFILSEKMPLKKWIGLIVGFIGFLPILLQQSTEEQETGHFLLFSYAEIAVLCAAACSVYGWILLGQLINEGGYSPITANGYSMLLGGAMALVNSMFVEAWDPVPVTEFLPFFECNIILILVSNIICYNLYGVLLRKFSPTFL